MSTVEENASDIVGKKNMRFCGSLWKRDISPIAKRLRVRRQGCRLDRIRQKQTRGYSIQSLRDMSRLGGT